ncbi:long-chain fatty acid--CoA ligase [Nocardioides endophyticus]|uniref:Long-chain fatty acid--CoA ligase n=1 Tax=Nocardioides endophyticus TaxID=1353775 RepID=A0ABP8Z0V0_9ACTN
MSLNLATVLEEAARTHAERPFVLVGEVSHTFASVERRAARIARGLLARGLRPGDRVAIHLPNTVEFVEAYFGILKAGLVMVPLNPLLAPPEIAFQVSDSGARLLVTEVATLASARVGVAGLGVQLVVVGSGGVDDFERLPEEEALDVSHATAADDVAVILYTSGTTGRPKGAELTHVQLYLNCTVAGELFDVGPDDVMTAVLPFFHVFGLSSVLNVAVRYGTQLVILRRFVVEDVLDAMRRHGVTVFSGVPTMFISLLDSDPAAGLPRTLRRGISGGAAMPVEVLRGVEEKFPGLVVLEGYGLSETGSCAAFNIDAEQRRVGSIGKPIWGVEMRVVDRDGVPLPDGPEHIGEIVIRGHNVMRGYLGRPEATAEAIRDGWFHSGDLGYRDADGFFYVADRIKDLIIRGGYNVYPREVEEVLYAHPDVAEAAVVGRPDDRLGEEVTAYVVLRHGALADREALQAHCRARLATYKYPRTIVLLDDLPKGPTGKILKRALRPEPVVVQP